MQFRPNRILFLVEMKALMILAFSDAEEATRNGPIQTRRI
jgi:hypothetical protein